MKRILAFALLDFVALKAFAQPVLIYDKQKASLADRWSWARQEAETRRFSGGFWIVYSIERLMDENSFIISGMQFSGFSERSTNLYDVLLSGIQDTSSSSMFVARRKNRTAGLSMINRGRKTPLKVMKDVAVITSFESMRSKPEEVQICNLELQFDFKKKPVVWLGSAEGNESIALLRELFRDSRTDEMRENLVNAIGIHQNETTAYDLLVNILKSKDSKKVRSQAAFWIGNQPRPEALAVLFEVAQSDDSKEVREQTIFAISQIESEDALDKLIFLARKGIDHEIRKKAIFWLGQKASRKVVSTLESMLADDEDTEVQKQALFALSRMQGSAGVARLIDIAKTHPKLSLRRQAIFALGQSDDPRAREALIELARGK